MKVNYYRVFGLIMIIIGVVLFFPTPLEYIVRPFTQPILMGSSKGKDILFFVLFGLTLILSTICDNDKIYLKFKSLNISNKYKNHNFYLKLSIVLFLVLTIIGLILELYLRYTVGTGFNTIFVAANPSLTTTSFLHSHLYKSIFGTILGIFLTNIPAGIHTGSSLATYTPQIANYLFILIPILYIIMIISLQKRKAFSRVILSFAISIGIIGIMDGGFFATPTVAGLYGLLVILLDEYVLDNLTNFNESNDDSKQSTSEKIKEEFSKFIDYIIFSLNNLKKAFDFASEEAKDLWQFWGPHLILLFIIILRFSIAIYGADDVCYELDIYNATEDIDLSPYNTLNITETQDKTIVLISNEYNEMELLNNLGENLQGKCDSYSLTWNFKSYLRNSTSLNSTADVNY
ncbi:MAG: hypothetical protein Q4P14_02475 [Methanobacteriaceae archaeon]|nr:hypothetical protein [Methanobacteriaceae archaeon]